MKLSERAESIFLDFGCKFSLVSERKTYDDGDVCLFFDTQFGLQEKVWMCFGNVDEISYGVGKFFKGSCFPCPDAFDDFKQRMDGILSGQYRIRYGRFKSVLEEQVGENWETRARYLGPRWNGFRFKIFVNCPK